MLADAVSGAATNGPVRTATPLASSCRVTASNSARSTPRLTSSARKRTKAVRSGVASVAEKPEKRRKLHAAVERSRSVDRLRLCRHRPLVAVRQLLDSTGHVALQISNGDRVQIWA